MEDHEIVALYWQRNEQAITESDGKYGALCRHVSRNLLGSPEDAEECVNDTWLAAWNAMPEERPASLQAWLLRVVRNISIDRWRKDHSSKRYSGIEVLLSELEECIPARRGVEEEAEAREIGRVIDSWLDSLPEREKRLFLLRYFDGEALKDIAKRDGIPARKLAGQMYRLRLLLKETLEKEGITL